MAETMKRNGYLHRRYRGVYAVGHVAAIELGGEAAALLACGAGALLSHRTGAALWGLSSRSADDPVDVTVRSNR